MTTINAHDDDDPESLVNMLDATMEAVLAKCEHCACLPTVTPALGTRWVLGVDHERGCPDFIDEDAIPTVVVQPRPEWQPDTGRGYGV